MSMTIFYRIYDNLYVNITNKCPCECVFCVRRCSDGVHGSQSLWLDREPDIREIKAEFDRLDLGGLAGIVFCGFGEPMERASDIIELCRYFKSKWSLPIRINTNGLVRLIHPGFDMQDLSEADSVSVSLNADDAEEYLRLTRSRFGLRSYGAMLDFARDAKKYVRVGFSVVGVLEPWRIENCRKIAEEFGVPLRVR